MMLEARQARLLILGHGSSKHPDSSASVRMHVEGLKRRGQFSEVHAAFLKESPMIKGVMDRISTEGLVVVPDFLAEGYFTREVIPNLLKLEAHSDQVKYARPVGTHPMMQELIIDAARAVLADWDPGDVSLLLVGHGSTKNPKSKESLLQHIEAMRLLGVYAQIVDLWLEEAPFVSDWSQWATEGKVVLVPFLLNDGQHGGWDIPEMLGLGRSAAVHDVTHRLQGRELRVAPALGNSARFVEVIEMMAKESQAG